ncbi:MAG: cell surface protein SprA, partial [Gemmatimonadales bacterium]
MSIDIQTRFELRTDRLKNLKCTTAEALRPDSGCRAKFKAPRLDTEFSALAGGVLGQRVHINADWDTQRELSATNTIQVFYQGLDDEIIRRIEIGTVSFQPPPSRFITAQIPSNNFGVNASFEVGPWQIQALAATQEGSVINERRFTIGATASEPQDRTLRDLDYESNRFFWVVDPTLVPGFPAVDILNLGELDQIPLDSLPEIVRVYRFRPRAGQSAADPNLGGINAFGVRGGSEPGLGARWQLMLQNTDYYLDPSGIWFVLNTKLAANEYLAVSFITASGRQVGTFPGQDQGLGPNQEYLDTLQLVGAPQTQLGQSIYLREMRQVYRVAGTDLNKSTLIAQLTLNRSERPLSGLAQTYLSLFGLALPSDVNTLDIANRVFPRNRDAGAEIAVRESYIVFPHLTPFADGTKLTSAAERQDSLYRTPTYLVLGSQGPPNKYSFRLQFEAAGGSDRSQVSLNALSVSVGTETLRLNGRQLERGVDYDIDYSLGLITFLDPDILFGTGTAQLVVTFEERGFFAIAPTSILGLTTTYSLGNTGSVNFMGMYQQEQSAFSRPPLGFEPTASFIGGVNTSLRFQPGGVTRFMNSLTSTPATAPSTLDVNAEFALSRPVANRIGEAYIEEFETESGFRVSMGESRWAPGSVPTRTDGLSLSGFGATFDTTDAVMMSSQNLIFRNGVVAEVFPQDIDPNIVIAGQGERQVPVLYYTFHADTAGGVVRSDNSSLWSRPQRIAPRFRSVVISLSNTGIDLSNSQFLEFWMFTDSRFTTPDEAGVQFMFDLGSVSEDALA